MKLDPAGPLPVNARWLIQLTLKYCGAPGAKAWLGLLGGFGTRRAPDLCHIAGAEARVCSMLSTLTLAMQGSQSNVRLSCSCFAQVFGRGRWVTERQPHCIAVCSHLGPAESRL